MKGALAMPAGGNSKEPADPMEMWEKWYDVTTKAWSKNRNESQEKYMDPFGMYQTWLKSVGNAQEQLIAGSFGNLDPKEAWKRWFESSTDIWEKAAEKGPDPLGLTTQWLEMMEEARARMAEGNIPADPFTFMKQWYDATSETWATVIGDIIGTERFMESASQFMESYTSLYRTFRRANEEFFNNLQLPTRSDIARVAELVIEVEDKVDQIEDAFEDFEDHYTKGVPVNQEVRLEQVERKLDALTSSVQKLTTVDTLEKRLDRLESKLDTLLIALEKSEAKELPKSPKSTNPPRSKAQAEKRESPEGLTLPAKAKSV
jgi:polyhydroxyalkanoic acid synthase PhaR subunit